MSEAAAGGWRALASPRGRRQRAGLARADRLPSIAVLCSPACARAVASGVALALARALGGPVALTGVVGGAEHAPLPASLATHRAAVLLRDRGLPAAAGGRLVSLADQRGPGAGGDAGARAAALSVELGHAAAEVGAPAAIALPFARTAALDRVLAWHDAIVVVPEPGAAEAVVERALASLAAFGRPLAAMAPPARLTAALASGGLRAPVEAEGAVARLGLGDGGQSHHG